LPHALHQLEDGALNVLVNGTAVLANEQSVPVLSGDEVVILAMIGGG
jgi:sulfur carrier protein ThiS